MLKKGFLVLLLFSCALFSVAQKGIIKGNIKDEITGEPLIGANVLIAQGVGVIADLDGNYEIEVDYGDYTLSFSYVGYEATTRPITVNKKVTVVNLKMKTVTLTEVEVVADVAIDRETPVAFTNVLPAQIEEELASQDIPMLLNSTPGVYATQQGGGDGDARITIRGFNQRNVAVMIDGIPVNDMENGWVYWSNWFGLDAVTRSIQVQRGLGASKIAIPSVGGTMNIITKGIEAKEGASFKQEYGSNGFQRSTLGYTTGKMKGGFGLTLAGSFKRGNGWVDQAYTKGYFFYAKIEKQWGKHRLSFSAMGAPQEHGQRAFRKPITTYDKEYAHNLGIDTTGTTEYGLQYNEHWGYLDRHTIVDGDTISNGREILNERINYYHKPQFSLRDFWAINDRLYISNMFYMSIGNGGGTGNDGAADFALNEDGQLDFQTTYNSNSTPGFFNVTPDGELVSDKILRTGINNHKWYGYLSTVNYSLSDEMEISGGIDLRYYEGKHYREVYDLLGGDVFRDFSNANASSEWLYRKGDKIGYHNDGLVKWGGAFAQWEYKTPAISTFLNLSFASTGYKRVDYFKRMDLVIDDEVFSEAVGYGDVFYYNNGTGISAYSGATVTTSGDTTYIDNGNPSDPDGYVLNATTYNMNSAEARHAQTKWKYLPGYTVKTGINYNLNEFHNVFTNVGYLSKAQRFNNVINNNNQFFLDPENEIIRAVELGYSTRYKKFATNLNAYYTHWKNRPAPRGITVVIDDVPYSANINGMNALHKGIEFDAAYKVTPDLTLEGLVSLGDWRWDSEDTVRFTDDNGNPVLDDNGVEVKQYFNAKGVHVGDAAQTQYAASLKYYPFKGFYIRTRVTAFERHYADFDPLTLDGSPNSLDENGDPRDSWKIPNYKLVDLHLGYSFKYEGIKLALRGSVLNLLNTTYLSDARNNDQFTQSFNDFDAQSAAVFFGQGRRFNISMQINF